MSASHTCLNLFEKVPVLEPILWSNVQQTFPVNSLNEASIDFQIETDRNIFLDLYDTFLSLKFKLVKDGNQPIVDGDNTFMVNNIMHSLFSNLEVYFNNEQVYTSNGLYAHKSFLSNEFSGTQGTKDSISVCQGYLYEKDPHDVDDEAFQERKKVGLKEEIVCYGRLHADVFTCDKLLLPNVNVRIKLIRSRPSFYLISDLDNVQAKIIEASIFTRQVAVDDSYFGKIKSTLAVEPARYNYFEQIPKTYIIPRGQNQFIQENVFNNGPIRSFGIVMNENSAFTGDKKENPFHFQKFGLREIRIVRGNQTIVEMNCVNDFRPYITTMEALKFKEDGPNVKLEDYQNHYLLFFDLTSMQESNVELYYPDIVASGLRLELYFSDNLKETVELMITGEKLSTVLIKNTGEVTKHG